MKASQSQIVEGARPSLSEGENMVHGKRYVLPLLCGMAILTQAICSLTDIRPDRLRNLAAGRQCLGILLAFRLWEITDKAVEQTQVIIDFLIGIQFVRFLLAQQLLLLFL